jgi:hypothetical protein
LVENPALRKPDCLQRISTAPTLQYDSWEQELISKKWKIWKISFEKCAFDGARGGMSRWVVVGAMGEGGILPAKWLDSGLRRARHVTLDSSPSFGGRYATSLEGIALSLMSSCPSSRNHHHHHHPQDDTQSTATAQSQCRSSATNYGLNNQAYHQTHAHSGKPWKGAVKRSLP